MHRFRRLADLANMGGTLCHGTFDLFHYGHLEYLLKAARFRKYPLIVTMTAGIYIKREPGRPIFSDHERVSMVAHLDFIGWVALVDEPTGLSAIRTIKPLIYCKGAETMRNSQTMKDEEELVESQGGRVEYLTKVVDYSSGRLLSGEILRERAS